MHADAFKNPIQCKGQTFPVVGEHISYASMAHLYSKYSGKHVTYVPVTRDQYASAPFLGAANLANMFQYYVDFTEFADRRPLDKTLVKCSTFEQWAWQNARA